MLNAAGDVVLTDPEAMRALAQPKRLALLDRLRRAGPMSSEGLAAEGEETPSDVAAQLRELERFGLVEADGRIGQAVGKGVLLRDPG
ncbi:MAG TPA: helix-turn-helix domain-containing protein [Gaiellaceae bacterium]|nr:helix-turn-helix domain-containing protein [Gaiellaceae bacterium]